MISLATSWVNRLTPQIGVHFGEQSTIFAFTDQKKQHILEVSSPPTLLHHGVLRNLNNGEVLLRQGLSQVAQQLQLPVWLLFPRFTFSCLNQSTEVEQAALRELAAKVGAVSVKFIPQAVALTNFLFNKSHSMSLILQVSSELTSFCFVENNQVGQEVRYDFGTNDFDEQIRLSLTTQYGLAINQQDLTELLKTGVRPSSARSKSRSHLSVLHGQDVKTGLPTSLKLDQAFLAPHISAHCQLLTEIVAQGLELFGQSAGQHALVHGVHLAIDQDRAKLMDDYLTDHFGFAFHPVEQPNRTLIQGMMSLENNN